MKLSLPPSSIHKYLDRNIEIVISWNRTIDSFKNTEYILAMNDIDIIEMLSFYEIWSYHYAPKRNLYVLSVPNYVYSEHDLVKGTLTPPVYAIRDGMRISIPARIYNRFVFPFEHRFDSNVYNIFWSKI